MSPRPPRKSDLAWLVDLMVQLHRDAGATEVELHRRDRALFEPPRDGARDPRSLLRQWLERLRAAGHALPGSKVDVAFRLQKVALAVAGLGVGGSVAAALFAYDGTRPVNVVHLLAVLVGLQLLLLLFLGFVLVPSRITRWIPGALPLQEMLAWASPGQITRLLIRHLPEAVRDWMGPGVLSAPRLVQVQKWMVVLAAQVFGVFFNLGALAVSLYLITFSDLAFAWSTTLRPDPEAVHRLTTLVAAPWKSWLPGAVPSRELIESTLYYRQTGAPADENPARWGAWWPFLIAGVVTYGLVPRTLLLLVARWRFRDCIREAFLGIPGVTGVLDRLTHELVVTQAAGLEDDSTGAAAASSIATLDASVLPARLWIVNWGGVAIPDAMVRAELARAGTRQVIDVLHAGGSAPLDSEARILETLAATSEPRDVAALVKAWEPPVLEFTDFLAELRRVTGPGPLQIVILVGLGDRGSPEAPRETDAGPWRRRLGASSDPDLRIRCWPKGRPS